MADSNGADTEVGETQTGTTEDKSQSESGSDKDVIPKKQFIAALNSANAKYEKLAAELAELRQAKENPPAKEPTRAELLKHVADGNITQEQADTIWEAQLVKKAGSAAVTAASQENLRSERQNRVESELREYQELVGDAWIDGTTESNRVKAEYKELVSFGLPSTIETEVAALRAAFGSLKTLRASKSAKSGPSESHVETGGSKPSETTDTKDGPPKGLTDRERKFYEKGIENGAYADWNAVKEERKFARKR